MALKKSIDFKGILVADAYIKVAVTTIVSGHEQAEIHVHYMTAPESPPFNSEALQIPFTLNGGNHLAQAYDHLKTLAAFADAEDC